jgi:hypothetical protein
MSHYTADVTKRLLVSLDDAELHEIQRLAHAQRLTVAEWVRQALRAARRSQTSGDVQKKLGAIRAAARHDFPTAEIEQMLAEIAPGYADRQPE